MNTGLDLMGLAAGLESQCLAAESGRVSHVVGLTVESVGPQASIGDTVMIESAGTGPRVTQIPAQVVGFRGSHVLLMPFEHVGNIRTGARVVLAKHLQIKAGRGLLGRVVDGLGRPIDGGPPLKDVAVVQTDAAPPSALSRPKLHEPFATGVRAIDGLMTMARGQRVGIMAGSGVGKSVLLGSIASSSCSTVNVIALIGERGREVLEFIEDCLGPALSRSVVVVVTSDQSALMRVNGAFTATAIAEYFRGAGENVLFLMDSVTRFAMAQREIGLAAGEPPTTKGYPPSVFGLLPRLMERTGTSPEGDITALYTVLVEGDDLNDPVADTCRSILDGHIVLNRELAMAGHYPAIDVTASLSRAMNRVVDREHADRANRVRHLMSVHHKAENLLNIGAYVKGSNQDIDESIARIDAINGFLKQRPDEASDYGATLSMMEGLLR